MPSFSASPPTFGLSSRYLIVGGGGEPDSSEVQLEADVGLAATILRGPGVTLFAGGASPFGVRESRRATTTERDDFRVALGMLFLPRPRASSVRRPRIHVDGAATYENVTRGLDTLLAAPSPAEPLLVVVSTHGEGADDPLDGYAVLWGNEGLFVRDVVDLLASGSIVRPSRWVVSSCYGGAFARIADVGAAAARRVALHCGVFATGPDRLASGCDASPERSEHEGYAKRLFSELGSAPSGASDVDHDGHLSLLEAHVATAIASESFDVPVTSSEHYARSSVQELTLPWEAEAPIALAETDVLVRALSEALELPNEGAARMAWMSVRQSLEERDEELSDLEAMRDGSWNRLRVALLERWPWLEDSYAPGWERRLMREEPAIRAMLFESDVAAGFYEATDHADSVADEADDLRVREARLARLVHAYELQRMAATLQRRAPERFARFLALRECERFVPAVADPRPSR